MNLSATFIRNVHDVHEGGEAWLRRLPQLIEDCEARWSIQVLAPFPGLSYNFAAPAVAKDGGRYVLKLGVPADEIVREIEALRLYEGQGIARLVDADPNLAGLLLERLEPGDMLTELEDDEAATRVAAELMLALWRPVPDVHPFLPLAAWFRGFVELREHFHGGTGPLPAPLVDTAERLYRELTASSTQSVLLHGDLHHYNILRSDGGERPEPWLAIDPKGVVGEPGYEVGPFLCNPMPQIEHYPDLKHILARRVDILSEILGMERARVAGWGVAHAVLSAWWSFEGHGEGWEPAIACGAGLQQLL